MPYGCNEKNEKKGFSVLSAKMSSVSCLMSAPSVKRRLYEPMDGTPGIQQVVRLKTLALVKVL